MTIIGDHDGLTPQWSTYSMSMKIEGADDIWIQPRYTSFERFMRRFIPSFHQREPKRFSEYMKEREQKMNEDLGKSIW